MQLEKEVREGGAQLYPEELHAWLTCVLYNRRSKMDPLWVSTMILGLDDKGEPFLGDVNIRGVPNTGDFMATGFGAYLCRQKLETTFLAKEKLSEAEAVQLLRDCQTILFYRDCAAYPEFDICLITKDGPRFLKDQNLTKDSKWAEAAALTRGYE